MRDAAARVFVSHAASDAVPSLLAAARDPHKNVRNAVAWALAKAVGEEAVLAALASDDDRLRFAAIRGVGGWRAPAQRCDALTPAIHDREASVRWAALAGRCTFAGSVQLLSRLARADPAATVRREALWSLKRLGRGAVVEVALEALADPDPWVRVAAASIVGDGEGARELEALIAAAEDPHVWVRWHAVTGLARYADERAVAAVITRVRDRKQAVRWQAALTLGMARRREAFVPLVDLLNRATTPSGKAPAVVGLGHLRDRRAVPALASALLAVWSRRPKRGAHDWVGRARDAFELRRDATKALLRIGGPEADDVLAALPRSWVDYVARMELF